MKIIVDLVLRMTQENPSWRYTRIRGALANLGHQVGRGTIANILKEHGIDPAPERDKRTPWSTFLKAHWECIAATDFFSVEVCTIRGLVTHYVLFFIDIASRTVKIAGITPCPDTRWMMQIARNLIDVDDGFLRLTQYLILDWDTKDSNAFRGILEREGIQIIRLPPTVAQFECIRREIRAKIFFGRSSLQYALAQYVEQYHRERNHQGLANQLLMPCSSAARSSRGPIKRRQRLGGMRSFYHREAA